MILKRKLETRAVENVFVDFLEQTAMRNDLRDKMIRMRERIVRVQRVRKSSMLMVYCKMQVLLKIWNREQNAMQMIAIKSKDKKQRLLVGDLNLIKDELKLKLLKLYLYMCSVRHSLAFFQWRD
jgi:hypothetical protein